MPPPIGSILMGDDRDPTKLLHFIEEQIDCAYSLGEIRRLLDNSLFLNPIYRICIKGKINNDDHCHICAKKYYLFKLPLYFLP